MKNLYVVFLLTFLYNGFIYGQDVHFTRFYDAPLLLNPAKAGDFNGTIRLGGIFRDQNYNLSNIYITPDGYIDAPIIRGFAKTHWVGLGLNLIQDRSGRAGLRNSAATLSGAYHIGVNKEMTSYFTIGASFGLGSRDIFDRDKFRFEDQLINNGAPSEDLNNLVEDKTSYKDIGAGLQYTAGLESGGNIKLGFALLHINRPKNGVVKTPIYRQPMRFNVYATSDIGLTEKLDLLPALYYSGTGGQREIAAQMAAGIKLNPLKNLRLIGGLGYRFGDAIEFLARLDIKNTKIGLSYDLTTNPIKPTGAFEASISHIIMIYKKPKDNPIILCPRI